VKPKKGEFYKHFKGTIYLVLGYAIHSETQEEMIIYKSYKVEKVWVRPLEMFIDVHSTGVKRFEKVSK
jgi:hypothetical protein